MCWFMLLSAFLASTEVSYKNRLQEYLQKKHLGLPFYETEKLSNGLFCSSLKVQLTGKVQVYHGKECTTKRAAEQSAAQTVCSELKLS